MLKYIEAKQLIAQLQTSQDFASQNEALAILAEISDQTINFQPVIYFDRFTSVFIDKPTQGTIEIPDDALDMIDYVCADNKRAMNDFCCYLSNTAGTKMLLLGVNPSGTIVYAVIHESNVLLQDESEDDNPSESYNDAGSRFMDYHARVGTAIWKLFKLKDAESPELTKPGNSRNLTYIRAASTSFSLPLIVAIALLILAPFAGFLFANYGFDPAWLFLFFPFLAFLVFHIQLLSRFKQKIQLIEQGIVPSKFTTKDLVSALKYASLSFVFIVGIAIIRLSE